MTAYKSYFDIDPEITYLATPGNGLLPKRVKEWRKKREIDFFDSKTDLRDQQGEFLANVRNTIADFFHSEVENTYLTANFSNGFNTVLNGLDPKMKILLLQDDYPSVNFPVINRGFNCKIIGIQDNLEAHLLQEMEEWQPDIFIFSMVNYISGLKIELHFIKQLNQKFPELLLITDGTQFLGTEPFDFKDSGLDAMGSSGYKWLLSGFGNGFMLLSDRLKEKLYVANQARHTPLAPMWDGKNILQLYFEPGHIDTLSLGTLQQSLHMLEKWKVGQIQQYLAPLLTQAKEEFAQRNLLLPYIQKRNNTSTIFNLQIDPKHFELLKQQGIKCFPRGTGIRIGFHLYNDSEDLKKLLNVVDKIL